MEDWQDMLTGGNFAKGVYFDSNQLILRSNKATWENNQPLINDLTKKLGTKYKYSSENPLLITGAKLIPSKDKNNNYGIDLNLDDAIIKNDERFAYGKNTIQLGNISKPLWTKKDGVSRLYLSKDILISFNGNLADSDLSGRVAVLNAAGVLPEEIIEYSEKGALEFLNISQKEYQLIKEIKKQK